MEHTSLQILYFKKSVGWHEIFFWREDSDGIEAQSFKGQETTNCDNDSTAVMESDFIPPCNCNRIIYIVSHTGRLRVHHRTAICLFQKSLFQGVYKYNLTNFQDTFFKNSRRFLRASYTSASEVCNVVRPPIFWVLADTDGAGMLTPEIIVILFTRGLP